MTARRKSLLGARRTGAGDAGLEDAKAKAQHPKRPKATFDLDEQLLAELRVVSVLLPREVVGSSLSALAESALREKLEVLRAAFNDGKPFPTPSDVQAKRGRPPKR